MSSHLHNVNKKSWFTASLRLSQLQVLLDAARVGLAAGEDPYVVAVRQPGYPLEHAVTGLVTRADALDTLNGDQLNGLAADLTDIDIDDAQLEIKHQLEQGQVIYLVLSETTDLGSPLVFDLTSAD